MPGRARTLSQLVAGLRPELGDPAALISAARVEVDGVTVTNPRSRVRPGTSVVVRPPPGLRGEVKLRAALETFAISVVGRVALDVGAAAGGFTRVLLEAGARRVYAVDAGHGQLLGSLRQDARVVNLEATNVAVLTPALIPETVEVVTIDVSYLSLSSAVAQLGGVDLAPGAHVVGLIKPMFELRLARAPANPMELARARRAAEQGLAAAGWEVDGVVDSPVPGSRGAAEMLIHAVRP
ncbi:MAG: SAM-dependent methyltransferase [Candidatus Dormibacteria bacterium]